VPIMNEQQHAELVAALSRIFPEMRCTSMSFSGSSGAGDLWNLSLSVDLRGRPAQQRPVPQLQPEELRELEQTTAMADPAAVEVVNNYTRQGMAAEVADYARERQITLSNTHAFVLPHGINLNAINRAADGWPAQQLSPATGASVAVPAVTVPVSSVTSGPANTVENIDAVASMGQPYGTARNDSMMSYWSAEAVRQRQLGRHYSVPAADAARLQHWQLEIDALNARSALNASRAAQPVDPYAYPGHKPGRRIRAMAAAANSTSPTETSDNVSDNS